MIPVNLIFEAMSKGTIVSDRPDRHVARIRDRLATCHDPLDVSIVPLALVMNRKKFDSLPKRAQDIIRKHSGEWPIASFVDTQAAVTREIMEQLTSNPGRKVVGPSQPDLDRAQCAFKSVVEE